LYRYHNRRLDGEIWYAVSTPNDLMLIEQNDRIPDGGVLLGEIYTRIVDDKFVDTVVPLKDRTPEEMRRRKRATERHRQRRLEWWRRYSFAERVIDSSGPVHPGIM
jgi:hypothetical protein